MNSPIDFLVIGAQKAGTTTLHDALAGHWSVSLPEQKETQFLSNPERQAKGLAWYREQFDASAVIRGEVDPSYLYESAAPEFVAAQGWNPRIVAVLRDPYDRARSHHRMSVRRGLETLDFAEALEAEPDRLRSGSWSDRSHFSYVDRGRYVEQLARWRTALPNAEFLLLYFDELRDAPEATAARVFSFLGIEATGQTLGHSHQAHGARSEVAAKLLWGRPESLRRILHKVVPSEQLRERLAEALDRVNAGRPNSTEPPPEFNEGELRRLVWDRLPWHPDDLAEIVGRPAPTEGRGWNSNGQRSS